MFCGNTNLRFDSKSYFPICHRRIHVHVMPTGACVTHNVNSEHHRDFITIAYKLPHLKILSTSTLHENNISVLRYIPSVGILSIVEVLSFKSLTTPKLNLLEPRPAIQNGNSSAPTSGNLRSRSDLLHEGKQP